MGVHLLKKWMFIHKHNVCRAHLFYVQKCRAIWGAFIRSGEYIRGNTVYLCIYIRTTDEINWETHHFDGLLQDYGICIA